MAGTLSVSKSDAVTLLEELDYEDAGDWSDAKLTNTLKKLKKEVEDPEEVEVSKPSKKLLLSVMKAKAIELEGDEDDDDEEEEEKPSKKSAKKASGSKTKSKEKPTKKKVAKKSKSEPANKDKFGSREGTEASSINALIGAKPTTLEKLRDKLPKIKGSRISAHIRFLKERGFIKIKDDKIVAK